MAADGAPLPPGFKVLFYGNSHVRQAVEAILCIYLRGRPYVEAERCDDDHSEFFFSNGAVAHFFFANDAANKTVSDALAPHQAAAEGFSYFDAVFANEGNKPPIGMDAVLDAAFELRDLGYIRREGDPKGWSEQQEADFRASGARLVRVGDMARGLEGFTRNIVAGGTGSTLLHARDLTK
eukprot:g12180.t1